MGKKTIVCEYVGYGHPDKIADQIADAILDEYLRHDCNVRAGIEVMVKDNVVVLGGEISSSTTVNYDEIVRKVFKALTFTPKHHLLPSEIKIINLIGKQSNEIHEGVDKENGVIGAGDQGFMVGYASNDTDVFMPLGHYIAKAICTYIADLAPIYGPDVKSQVTIEFDENNVPTVKHILVSTMHQGTLSLVRNYIEKVILNNEIKLNPDIYNSYIKDNEDLVIDINPCGEWHIGGPVSDCGITGRKLVVDAYGGYCNIGGGNLSGKDYTKVDRSAAYLARYLAKNIVASGICNTAKVTLGYMIGVAEPTSIDIELDKNNDQVDKIKDYIMAWVKMSPKSIIERFGYEPRNYILSRYGHYGFDVCNDNKLQQLYPWEKIDFADSLKLFLK